MTKKGCLVSWGFVPWCLFVLVLGSDSPAAASDYRVYCGSVPAINYMGRDGRPQGIAVDILMDVMKAVGHPLDPSDFACSDWPGAMASVAENPKAMLISAALTPEREFRYRWVGPVAETRIGLIGRKSDVIDISGSSSLMGLKTAVIKGSAPMSMLRALCPGCDDESIVAVNSNAQQFALLREGKVDLIGQSDLGVPLLMERFGLDPDKYEMVRVLTTMNLYILLNRRVDPDLLVEMQNALDNMTRTRLKEIYESHLGGIKLSVRPN